MSRPEERKFGVLGAVVFGLIAFWPLWPLHPPRAEWLLGAGVWLLVALIFPLGLRPLYRLWMGLGHVLGWINARIILALVFFCVVTPIGWLLRLVGKDPLRRRRGGDLEYWVVRDQGFDPESFRNQF